MRSLLFSGIVLKRSDVGEKDQVVTVLTQEKGKLVSIAKGVRSLTSSKRSSLEPGSYIKGLLQTSHALPILTQSVALGTAEHALSTLTRIRQLAQFLEILDRLFVEEEIDESTFEHLLYLHGLVCAKEFHTGKIKDALQELLMHLGFTEPDDQPASVLAFVAQLTDKPMRSFDYLVVK